MNALPLTVALTVSYGALDCVPIDQAPIQKFNIDPLTGRPTDIMNAITKARGLEQQRLLAELPEFKSEFLPPDVSDEDALRYACPRLSQMPSELALFQEELVKQDIEKELRAQYAADEEAFNKAVNERLEVYRSTGKLPSSPSGDDISVKVEKS